MKKIFILFLLSTFLSTFCACVSSKTSNEVLSLRRSVENLRAYQMEQSAEVSRLSEDLKKMRGVVEELQHYKEQALSAQKVAQTSDLNIQPALVGDLASDKIVKGRGLNAIVPENLLKEDEIFASKQNIEFGREMLEMLENIKGNKFREALTISNDLITSATEEQQARVLFWRGICSDAVGNNKDAIVNYNSLLTTFSSHARAPIALYNQALVLLRIKDKETAKMSLQKLINEYPNSEYSEKAKKKLRDI
ncbi:MAG: tetratricopeptide repeat protein [Bdellovibrionota bacterium]